ncbi:hypothetical protein, partial [Janthinobacterium sp.]|uniref:hypothetical protein n=1 Tax=Janthinobacterium sp. TaxID=1871054 RepID=UPI00293D27CD
SADLARRAARGRRAGQALAGLTVAGLTAGGESHPAPKTYCFTGKIAGGISVAENACVGGQRYFASGNRAQMKRTGVLYADSHFQVLRT